MLVYCPKGRPPSSVIVKRCDMMGGAFSFSGEEGQKARLLGLARNKPCKGCVLNVITCRGHVAVWCPRKEEGGRMRVQIEDFDLSLAFGFGSSSINVLGLGC